MPIYEYRCDDCGHYLDALQKMADDPLKDCPACEASTLRRLVSAPNFRLKGKGWYETDFKSDKETKRNLVDRPDEAPAGKDKGEPTKSDGGSGKGASGKRESASGKSGAQKPEKPSSKSGGGAGPKSASRSGRGSGSAAA